MRAAIVEHRDRPAVELLAQAADSSGFWNRLEAARSAASLPADQLRILIKIDLLAFDRGSPGASDPVLAEFLIDSLHARGFTDVNLCASADSSFFWAENRDVAILADLLGYNYRTPEGHDYDVLDLSEGLVAGGFPDGSLLHGSSIARAWRDAHFRVCIARNKTDEREAYALCLSGLRDVLPLVDKDYHYRHKLAPADVVAELLQTMPIQFAVVDASVSAHGSGGGRAPSALDTACVIASADPLLTDFAAALKMGLDPYVSPLAGGVFRRVGLPDQYTLDGNLAVYPGWRNVQPALLDSYRRRDASMTLDRLITPWLQTINSELFPLKQLLDAKLNPRLSEFFRDPDASPLAISLLTFVNYAVGTLGQWTHAYRVLHDKDGLRQLQVPLGMDPDDFAETDYQAIRPELDRLESLLGDTPEAAEGLRWREIDGATVFEFRRNLPIPFEQFVERVDVARTIQLMNDYIGGVVVPTGHDEFGRVVRQVERNLYLPQPNYLVLYQGQPIDVSKIEICDYGDDRQRMYWKTIKSENASARHDDGVVYFSRSGRGTLVRILGRQLFMLPPFWQAMDLNLVPDVKSALVTHAYKTFFERTCANFEALVEEREIRIGRAWQESEDPYVTEPLPAQRLQELAVRLIERFDAFGSVVKAQVPQQPARVDEDGFRHFEATSGATAEVGDSPLANPVGDCVEALLEFFAGLNDAVARDLAGAATGLENHS